MDSFGYVLCTNGLLDQLHTSLAQHQRAAYNVPIRRGTMGFVSKGILYTSNLPLLFLHSHLHIIELYL